MANTFLFCLHKPNILQMKWKIFWKIKHRCEIKYESIHVKLNICNEFIIKKHELKVKSNSYKKELCYFRFYFFSAITEDRSFFSIMYRVHTGHGRSQFPILCSTKQGLSLTTYLSPCSTIHFAQDRLFTVSICPSCLQYVLYVSTSPSLLSSL